MNTPVTLYLALWVTLLTASCAASDAAADRPNKVGLAMVEYVDQSRDRPLKVKLWYPAVQDADESPGSYDLAFRARAAKQADYLTMSNPRPLVLLSHGDKGSNVDQSWLAEALAANGYIVAAPDHWLNTWRKNEPQATLQVWERPRDLSFVISALLNDDTWGQRIDAGRIGSAGHSSGGYTAMALAGAIYSPQRMAEYCMGPDKGRDCSLAKGFDIGAIDFTPASKSYRDERVRAVFAMAPALGAGIDQSSLQTVNIPVHVIASRDDEILAFERNAASYARQTPGAHMTALDRGGHFVFMPECTFLGKLFTWNHDFDICGRRSGLEDDRPDLHARVAREALAFFNASLAGQD